MDTDATDVISLIDGERLILRDGRLTILDATGRVVRQIDLSDISGVRRGGRDLVVICRATDPLVVTTATLADAQRFVDRFQQHVTANRAMTWWKRPRRAADS